MGITAQSNVECRMPFGPELTADGQNAELIEPVKHSTISTSQSARDNGIIEIAVTDSGVGISPQDLPRIFDKFFQGHAGVQKKGSGLGLAIVQHIIQAHGGSIRAESEPSMGTTFHITLPVQETEATSSVATPEIQDV